MSFKVATFGISYGRGLPENVFHRLDLAVQYGYHGIGVYKRELEGLARCLDGGATEDNQIQAARSIRCECDKKGLSIICLQPFRNYEGLTNKAKHTWEIEELRLWFRLAKMLRTDLLVIQSNILTECTTGEPRVLIEDFRKLAKLGQEETPVIRFAFEALCYGKYINTWDESWRIAVSVNSPNFGLCLDTFEIAGKAWADPASPNGTIPDAEESLQRCLKRMRLYLDVRKIFHVKVIDGARLSNPLGEGHEFFIRSRSPRMNWASNCRQFPFETAGYLPIIKILETITDNVDESENGGLGYVGWISLDPVSSSRGVYYGDCPEKHVRRGMESFRELVKVMHWEDKIAPPPSPSKP